MYVFQNVLVTYKGNGGDVVIPNSVTEIGVGVFGNCSSVRSITMPNSVTRIGKKAFYYCTGLVDIIFSKNVKEIGEQAFESCSGFTSISLPNSVTSIGPYAFYGCSSLKSITIPDSVTYIPYEAFFNCANLSTITLGSSVEMIGKSAFYKCDRISKILTYNPNPPYIYDIKDAFANDVISNAIVHIPIGSYDDYSSAYGWRDFCNFKEDLDVNAQSHNATLKIQQGEYGYIQHYVKYDEEYTLGISETANAKVNTILFNGEDITYKLIDGYLTIPITKSNSILSISYNITPSNIKDMVNSSVKVSAYSNVLNISGLKDNDDFKVFSTNGALIESGRGNQSLPLEDGVYIIKVGEETFKVAL